MSYLRECQMVERLLIDPDSTELVERVAGNIRDAYYPYESTAIVRRLLDALEGGK